MLVLPRTECGRFISLLSELYGGCRLYPSDPSINEFEFTFPDLEAGEIYHTNGPFANCRLKTGLFLGDHKVTMKRLRDPGSILPEIVEKASMKFPFRWFRLLISLTI